MAWYWWVLLIGVTWWAFRKFWRIGNLGAGQIGIDHIDGWLKAEGFDPTFVNYSAYDTPWITDIPGSVIVVGYGKRADGENKGFAVQVLPDRGKMLDWALITPSAASYHKTVARDVRMLRRPFMDLIRERSFRHAPI